MRNILKFRIQPGQLQNSRHFIEIFAMFIFSFLFTGCIGQQADSQKLNKDLYQQITQIRNEYKTALNEERMAIAKSWNLIETQQAEIKKMQSDFARREDLAPMNQQIKLMREEDLPSVYGQFEAMEKKISDLQRDFAAHDKNFSTTTGNLGTDIQALQTTVQAQGEQQQLTQIQATTLVQQVDENNQALTKKMTEFQTALGQFKETLGSLGADVSQTQTNIGTIKNDISLFHHTKGAILTKAEATLLLDRMTQLRDALENERP